MSVGPGSGTIASSSMAIPDSGEPTFSVGVGFGGPGASHKRNTTMCFTVRDSLEATRSRYAIEHKLDQINSLLQRRADELYRSQVSTYEGEVSLPEPNVSFPEPTPQRDSRSRPSPQSFGDWLKQGMKD